MSGSEILINYEKKVEMIETLIGFLAIAGIAVFGYGVYCVFVRDNSATMGDGSSKK